MKWPIYDEKEKQALKKVLLKGQWGTLGDEALEFAETFKAYCGCHYGISVTNGTVSLEIILRSLGIGYGDEVIVPAYTFISTITSVALTGAVPILVDVEADTFNIDPEQVLSAITDKTKAVMVTHFGGRPCDMDRLAEICAKRNLYLIEDAAHAHGSEWRKKRAGSLGDVSSFSFQSSKNLTCGEGGFIGTNDYCIFQEAWHYHTSGRSWDDSSEFGGTVLMGTNARMAEWEAAILNVQITRLDSQITTREANARYLTQRLGQIPFIHCLREDERITRNSYHLFLMRYDAAQNNGMPREEFIRRMNQAGVSLLSGYAPLQKMGAINGEDFARYTGRKIDYASQQFPNADALCNEEAIWLRGSDLLGSFADMDAIISAMRECSAKS